MKKILLILLTLALLIFIILWSQPTSTPKKQNKSTLVQVISLEKKTLSETVSAYGSLQVNPNTAQSISLPISTVIQHLFVSAGQIVSKGDPLFSFLPDLAVQLNYKQAKNNLLFAQNEAKRTQRLYDQQLATQSQLAAANKAVQDAQQALQSAQSQGSSPVLQMSKAPFDGVITQVAAAVGNGTPIQSGTVLVQIGHCDSMAVQLNVDPSDIPHIQNNASVVVTLLDKNHQADSFQGSISQITYVVNPQTRLMDVWVDIPHLSCKTWPPGIAVEGKITLSEQQHWVVPESAVLKDSKGSYLYRVVKNHAEKIYVTPIVYDREQIGIEGPVSANNSIVIVGNYELKNHALVRRV